MPTQLTLEKADHANHYHCKALVGNSGAEKLIPGWGSLLGEHSPELNPGEWVGVSVICSCVTNHPKFTGLKQ